MSCKVHFKDESSSLSHYGVKGQRWGIRRFQNEDGSLTSEGRKRYAELESKEGKTKQEIKMDKFKVKALNYTLKDAPKIDKAYNKQIEKLNKAKEKGASEKKINRIENLANELKIKNDQRVNNIMNMTLKDFNKLNDAENKSMVAGIYGGVIGQIAYDVAKVSSASKKGEQYFFDKWDYIDSNK